MYLCLKKHGEFGTESLSFCTNIPRIVKDILYLLFYSDLLNNIFKVLKYLAYTVFFEMTYFELDIKILLKSCRYKQDVLN